MLKTETGYTAKPKRQKWFWEDTASEDREIQEAEVGDFWRYWKRVKDYIIALVALPTRMAKLRKRANDILTYAGSIRDTSLANSAEKVIDWYDDNITAARKSRDKVEKHAPAWKNEANAMRAESGALGALPVVLTVVGMGALAYVTIKGLRILKEYGDREAVINALEEGHMTGLEASKALAAQAGEAKGLKARFFGGMFGGTGGIVGMGFGLMIVYWMFGKMVKRDVGKVKKSLKI